MPESRVINASPIILLAKVGLIDLACGEPDSLIIPEPVVEEILAGDPADAARIWLQGAGRAFVRPSITELAGLSSADIGPGERSVISWASSHTCIAVLDDREARSIARRLGVTVLGTVGVIVRFKHSRRVAGARPYFLKLREAGAFVSDDLPKEALSAAGESL